ncbi:MAG: FAD-dependent oxidoreductase, partial [Gammaproteobacteria bacterium]|nr:FAD-dependent oxidoreductase [Gammaproteobacteria bacterium]
AAHLRLGVDGKILTPMPQTSQASQTLWSATAPPDVHREALRGGMRAEVTVVGAGYTGLSAALHLSEAGRAVVVLDSEPVGECASGRNGGQVIPGLKYDPDTLEHMFGGRVGEKLVATVAGGPDLVFDLIRRLGIDCEPIRNGWLQLATSESTLGPLAERVRQWRDRGAAVDLIDPAQTARLTGSQRYCGGLLDRRGGTVQPLRYVRGLAAAVERAGGRVFTGSAAVRLSRAGAEWQVSTAHGNVTSRHVVLATNAYSDGLVDALRRTFVAVPSLQAATAPLSEEQLRTILPERQSVSDTWRLLRYFRVDGSGRLVMGSRGAFGRTSPADAAKPQHRAVREIYPQLAGVPFDYHWSGWVAITRDHLPHLHEVSPGVVAGLGYNGRGVAMATTMGKLLARHVLGEPAAELGFPVTPIRPLCLHALSRWGAAAAIQYLRLRDAFER